MMDQLYSIVSGLAIVYLVFRFIKAIARDAYEQAVYHMLYEPHNVHLKIALIKAQFKKSLEEKANGVSS